jgi:hypothetical protein
MHGSSNCTLYLPLKTPGSNGTESIGTAVVTCVTIAWGGWEDWETFRDHYLGEFSPEAIRRERGKVDHLEGGDENADVVHPGTLQL